CQQGITLPLTF
nr:immunoglobulin light chain junction region [Mus musculus]NSL99119.1 immunoglobulin light chain junction region [Mus musculus]